jgi:CHAD domain-containing protein
MRIAIRRARAALMLFKPTLEPHALAQFTDALRRLGRLFGEARDWDVFCTDMLTSAEAGGVDRSWLDLLREPAEAQRAVAHAHVASELEAPLLTATVLGLQTWDAASDTPLADAAPALLAKLDQKVRHRGRHIAKLDDEGLHKLRKSLKKLRYGIEFLAPLLREKDTKQYLHDCKSLLKRLGALNDAVVAVALAEQLGGERKPELAPAVSALAEWAANQRSQVRQHIEADWDKLLDNQLPH